ncbi:hypothetical protein [Hymenobacter rubripertinctus]|uniref:hypothetical protein n=1 Tax=Hymenobacter rubripertinctus TaxID=2029981 RepID=UPI0011C35592|nr:hypothetical protein [Hymenobacter rubripertinctus]
MIEKTEAHSILFVFVTGDKEVGKIIVRKKNWWWWDSLYTIARQFKWLDGDSFGINKNGKLCYLSVSNEEIVNNIVFKSSDF